MDHKFKKRIADETKKLKVRAMPESSSKIVVCPSINESLTTTDSSFFLSAFHLATSKFPTVPCQVD